MPDTEWLTTKEIADQLGVLQEKVQTAVRALRRADVIRTTVDPRDERYTLVHVSALDAIKRWLRIGVQPGDTNIA